MKLESGDKILQKGETLQMFKMRDLPFLYKCSFNFLRKNKNAKSCKSGRKTKSSSEGLPCQELCRQFSLAEIKAATKNFHRNLKITGGSYGYVYKGFINDGTSAVTIKRPHSKSYGKIYEFKNEVRLLCQLQHPNIVSLIGFCQEKNEMIIVTEHMNNGTLCDHLYGSLDRDSFRWERRLEVCIGVARALHYLHSGVKYAIIHRGVKSSNIFLNENWTAKLSNFESSKIGPLSMSKALIRVDSEIRGTIGYLAPEYLAANELTEKSDVYSFGVVLLEILCARRAMDTQVPEQDQICLTTWACKCIENGTVYDIIDPYLKGKIAPECFGKFVEIARNCISWRASDRPSMGEVEVALELALELQQKGCCGMKSNI